jgi:2'-5' RNA ligase
MTRLFTAIEIPAPIRAAIAAPLPLRGARWVREDQVHLTLRFIGQVEAEVGPRIAEALSAVGGPRFALRAGGAGVFPSLRSPRILWIGVEPTPALLELKRAIDRALLPLVGADPDGDRPFHPHLTAARLKTADRREVQATLQTLGELRFEPFEVDRFSLFSSRTDPAGAHYTRESVIPLGVTAAGEGEASPPDAAPG